MAEQPLVLLVEDDVPLAQIYQTFLRDQPFRVRHVATGKAALEFIGNCVPDVMMLDLLLPDIHGLAVLEAIRRQALPIDVVVVTTEASTEMSVSAIKNGAIDYIVKPLDGDRLITTLHNVLERRELARRLRHYESLLPGERFEGFIGASPAMLVVYRIIESAASSDASVFITGESGTGKELCAEAIHHRSARKQGPFVPVNCGAIPKDLLESEIFGHVKGAFTGAHANHKGAARLANCGTLFFDEICELSLDLQVKLLRFTQSRQFKPVGSGTTEKTNVRFICATNRDPYAEVEAGRFREDLFYRLFVVHVPLPPLREREDDIELLANHFLNTIADQEGKTIKGFSPEALRQLRKYTWPGNVRQLRNIMHSLVVLVGQGVIEADQLNLPTSSQETRVPIVAEPSSTSSATIVPLLQQERDIIERAIRLCDGNVAMAAAKLGISDSTIYRKMKRWENALH